MRVRTAGGVLLLVAISRAGFAPLAAQSPPSILVDCGSESLQDALDAAPSETTLVVSGRCGPIAVRKSVTLMGAGSASIVAPKSEGPLATVHVISGRAVLSRLSVVGGLIGVSVESGARVTLRQVAVGSTAGAGIRVWGGGHLIATDVYVGGSLREGIRIDGLATISRSVIEHNQWEGIVLTGPGPVTIEDATVRNNMRDGIFMEARDVLIRRSHVTRNAQNGLAKFGPGSVSVQHSSFTYNGSAGMNVDQNGAVDAMTIVRVTNSTFAFNQTGFVVRILEDLRHDVRLTHATVARNLVFGLVAQVDIHTRATVVSANGDDCDTPEGRLLSGGWTLVGSPGPCVVVAGAGDLLGVPAHLGAIATDGVTQFVPLLAKSPGIDSVSLRPLSGGVGPCVTGVKTDQRGLARPAGAGCDIGAIERRPGDP